VVPGRREREEGPAAVDDDGLAADHLGLGRAEERDTSCQVLGRDNSPDGVSLPHLDHRVLVREVLERSGLDHARRDGVHVIPWRELDGEIATSASSAPEALTSA
jgi:hypothetical protein